MPDHAGAPDQPVGRDGGAPLQQAAIRALDLVAAVAGGVVTLPLVLVAAVLVKLDSPGPALFRQDRVGRGETIFICYKLRTMAQGTREGIIWNLLIYAWAGVHYLLAAITLPKDMAQALAQTEAEAVAAA